MAIGLAIVIGVFWTLSIVLQPLIAMAKQAQAWVKLSNSFKTEARQRVSEVLSPQNDAFYLAKKYEDMQDIFTWNILGMQILMSAIAKVVTTYFSVVFASII